MKNIKIIIITMLCIIFVNCDNVYSYESNRDSIVCLKYGVNKIVGYNFEELYELHDAYINSKIDLNECVINGIKILNKIEKDIKCKNAKNSDDQSINTPLPFVKFIYKNYNKLSQETINELNRSLWSIEKYINKKFTSDEISILESVRKKLFDGKTNTYDIIDAFEKLRDSGRITHNQAVIYVFLIMRYKDVLPFNTNVDTREFYQNIINCNLWLYENEQKLDKNNDDYRIIQLVSDPIPISIDRLKLLKKKENDSQIFVFRSHML